MHLTKKVQKKITGSTWNVNEHREPNYCSCLNFEQMKAQKEWLKGILEIRLRRKFL